MLAVRSTVKCKPSGVEMAGWDYVCQDSKKRERRGFSGGREGDP